MAEHTANSTGSGRFVSKKDANRAAAATRIYMAASNKAGKGVPESVRRLAGQGS